MAAPKKAVGPKSDKIWRDALMRAVRRVDKGTDAQYLDRLADKVVQLGLEGEASAYKEIGDRLDGKAHQTTELTIDDKRDASDWTRAELVAFLNNARDGSAGAVEADGRGTEPNQVH